MDKLSGSRLAQLSMYYRALADYMVPQDRPGDFNQALMELGATLCTPQKPDCKHCPVQKNCRALEEVKSTQKLLNSEKRVKDESEDESEVDIEGTVS